MCDRVLKVSDIREGAMLASRNQSQVLLPSPSQLSRMSWRSSHGFNTLSADDSSFLLAKH